MNKRQAPKANDLALEKLLDKMYISNVSKRLRELNQPSDIDRKRWIWELLQNAKDTIANNPNRDRIKARILIDGDIVKFQHDGDPFTADARLGLLYKYSEDKENAESTGRFGTGFLTTHCLSKIVSIESNMYGDGDEIIGFSVTMYRDGFTEGELLEGLIKMRNSEEYWDEPYEWTTYTYHVNSESGRRAIFLGKENFKENMAQTLLFCKEIESIELNDNGEITTVKKIADDGFKTTFEIISGSTIIKRSFLYYYSENIDEDLAKKYKTERSIRLSVACEIDESDNIVSTENKTSLFCVFPLVGIEDQMQMPIFVNSPDFEPDSERQSLILSGNDWDEEKDVITEVGINQRILGLVPNMYRNLIDYLSTNHFNGAYNVANGLKSVKDHPKLDKKWYSENIITSMRNVLSEYPIARTRNGEFKNLSNCIFVKETKEETETTLYGLISEIYAEELVSENRQWAHALWKDESSTLKVWALDDFCADIESKATLSDVVLSKVASDRNEDSNSLDAQKLEWYNRFLKFVAQENELLLKEHALIPNMNGLFLKKDAEGFKQAEGISDVVLSMLASMGEDMKPHLLHQSITTISLDAKFNSISFSAKANSLAKNIIDAPSYNSTDANKLSKLQPLFSIVVTQPDKYEDEFINKRKRIFEITKDLFELTQVKTIEDNCLTKAAWETTDVWLTNLFIRTIENKGKLSALPSGLNASWLNDSIISLGIPLTKMNDVSILPNQNGDFCKSQNLYIDNGIPDVLKNPVFDFVGLSYKKILLDTAINATALGKTQSKSVSDFAQELRNELSGNTSCGYNDTKRILSFGRYHKYDENTLLKVAHYLVQILPESDVDGILQKQEAIKSSCRFFLGEVCRGIESTINYTDENLWLLCNSFLCREIMSKIEESKNIDGIKISLGIRDDELFEHLNIIYKFIQSINIPTDKRNIVPDQEGTFKSPQSLFVEGEPIDKELKDIINLISDDANNYYKILVDSRCEYSITPKKTLADAYSHIDNTISDLYSNQSNWNSQNFKEAVRLLIDIWGDGRGNVFDANHFPKVFPIRDSLSMNVVWTKTERHQLQQLKNTLSMDELSYLIEHSGEIQELSSRAKQLEEENDRLREIIRALKEGQTIDIDIDEDSDNSLKAQYAAQIEAQRKLMELFTGWQFPDKYGEQDENGKPYCFSNINVIDENGQDLPIVLKSYKSHQAPFKINTNEWEWVVERDARLFVYTPINGNLDIVEIPQDDLVMNQSNISITFNSENLNTEEYKERVSNFASTLHYFSGLHFKFSRFHVKGNATRVRDIYAIHKGEQTEQEF